MIDQRAFQKAIDRAVDEARSRGFTRTEGMYRRKLMKRVRKYMGWDAEKTKLWFSMENPNLGSVAPDVMIKMGSGHKLEDFIVGAINGE